MSKEVVIVKAKRSPFGKFGGSLASFSAVELGGHVIKSILNETPEITSENLEQVIMGIVVNAGVGQIPSRQAAAKAGLGVQVKSLTINKVCASGMKAVGLAAQSIRAGDGDIFIAGGMESMSNTPYLMPKARWGARMGDAQLVDAMIHDGLWCAFHDVHMGIHGSAVAAEYKVSREAQDEWALRSHERAHKATESGRLAQEIAPLVIPQKKGDPLTVALDESIRPDTTLEKLAKLKPVFDASGTVTAGNAPGINDGAAALLVMSREKADALGLKPLARIVAYGEVAEDYPYLATAPAHAIQVALKKADLTLAQLDRIEINEAFASVALISSQILGADAEKVNVHGGAIAMGHPIGASGARLIGTLVYELMSQGLKYGAAAICSGSAQGDAIIIENLCL
ncbi:acetyl-CoA C-acyltransferase [bacterium (Candidatus Blackallbacteria) CG17_big_fil_post_rev_8_21_14_2_50_48_46]|uniref:Acetyl-CoA C-acyltransferase n=1 Tax=bacterium (Candidatus Blackallbacteria) CG17_big_fil_post_rev_8_21_14_2_50_48_46 TaxID=2014261 RepID=A0A2M7G975_9BACT|nr:MAG: acetyl-CoA C-acyltransferase [bacterium (Candidatus Blackallbacteria) CG18_big_fil_WC_8_21_14_2_50_49_26]PIW18659.1 MAG: acetyl-CoA C-acyltransferase [bacterium (Candidatus Blackallbacteria) CG17_big_fil_post_rev_8_21_14_2_50_48_46]PIW46355.1 MAG: acetyl-CoA C-acyltransferase [bacterium (Candidatus Blackallbacteria) CG13_big_fil_rev_8_21_14_2_50_49_14]